VAKHLRQYNREDTSGTPGYMALGNVPSQPPFLGRFLRSRSNPLLVNNVPSPLPGQIQIINKTQNKIISNSNKKEINPIGDGRSRPQISQINFYSENQGLGLGWAGIE